MGSDTRSPALVGLARGSGLNLFGGLATGLLTMALVVVVTRLLGQAEAGSFFSVVALFQVVVVIGTLGVDTGWVRSISGRRAAQGGDFDLARILTVGLVPVLVAALALAWVGYRWAADVAAFIGDGTGASAALVRSMAPYVIAAIVFTALLGATRGFGTMRPTVVLDRIARPALQLAAVWGVLLVGTVDRLGPAWAVAYVAGVMAAVVWLGRLARGMFASPIPHGLGWVATATQFWTFTGPRALASTFRVGLQWLDVVLVAALASLEEVAVYTVATRLLQMGVVAAQALGQAVEPRFARSAAAGDTAGVQLLYGVSTTWLVLLTWPFYILIAMFASPILTLFGPEYATGSTVVLILVTSVLVSSAAGPVDTLLLMTGKSQWSLWNTAAALAVNISLNIWLIPLLGITGAAIGWAAGRIVANLLPLWQLVRAFGYTPTSRPWVAALIIPVATVGVATAAARLFLGDSVSAALLGGATGLTLYAWAVVRRREAFDLHVLAFLFTGTARAGRR